MTPKPDKFMPALYGGVIMALISNVPFISFVNCFCCAGILLGGFLAVTFYKNNFTPDTPPIEANDCMMIGLLAGIIGAAVGSFLHLAVMAVFGNMVMDTVLRWLHKANVNLPDEVWQKLEDASRERKGLFQFLSHSFLSLIIDSIFGLLGGLIGYSVYKPKVVPLAPPPPPPPPQSM